MFERRGKYLFAMPFFYFLIKMEDSITVVVCSKEHNEEKKNAFIDNINNTCGCKVHVLCVLNPDGVGLTQIYDDMLNSGKISDNIVAFIHDDIEFLKKGWGKEILRLFSENPEYGIIGVAGAAQFDEMGAWWNYSKKYGQVLHRSEGKSWLTAFSPLLDKDLEEVCVIDGLFMAVCRDRLKSGFDTNVNKFDFYDITFCIDNFLKGVKIGVTTNIRIAHNSVGKLKESWYVNREYANKKYKDVYPINISKKK